MARLASIGSALGLRLSTSPQLKLCFLEREDQRLG